MRLRIRMSRLLLWLVRSDEMTEMTEMNAECSALWCIMVTLLQIMMSMSMSMRNDNADMH